MAFLHANDPKIKDLLEALGLAGKYVIRLQLTVEVGGTANVEVEYRHYVDNPMKHVRDLIERRVHSIDDTSKLVSFLKNYELHEIP